MKPVKNVTKTGRQKKFRAAGPKKKLKCCNPEGPEVEEVAPQAKNMNVLKSAKKKKEEALCRRRNIGIRHLPQAPKIELKTAPQAKTNICKETAPQAKNFCAPQAKK